MNKETNRWKQWGFIFFLVSSLIYWLWKASLLPIHDFSNAYVASFFLQHKLFDATIYDALLFNKLAVKEGFFSLFLAYYPNTPFLAFFFYPFSFLDITSAKCLFNGGSVVLFLSALFRLQQRLGFSSWLYVCIPFLFFNSLRNGLYFGQVYFLLFFLLVVGAEAYSNHQNFKGAFYWGIALLLKVFPILLGGLLLTQKHYRGLIAYGFVVLGGIACSFLLIDGATWIYYLLDVLPQTNMGNYYNGFSSEAQSATMFFKHCFISDDLLNPNPIYASRKAYLLAEAIYKTGILSIVLLFSWRSKHDFFTLMGGWVIATTLLSPGLSSYAGILLLFPWLIVVQKNTNLISSLCFSFWVACYVNLPIRYFSDLPLLFQFPKLYLLLLIFGQYILGLKEEKNNKKEQIGLVVALLAIFTLLGLLKKEAAQNQYVIEKEEHILISDYFIKEGRLVYKYWTIPQPKYIETSVRVEKIDTASVMVKNNQIYYQNQPLTKDKSMKKKPVLVNDNEVFYLSDQNRGIGFYTLMKVVIDKE